MRSYKENSKLIKMLYYGSQYENVTNYEKQEEYERLRKDCIDEIKSVYDAFHPKMPDMLFECFVPEVPDIRNELDVWLLVGSKDIFKNGLDFIGDDK